MYSNKTGMVEYVDNFLAENAALKRKLQSKAEALIILSKELDQCRTERDQFKLMAEQLQLRYSALKKKSQVLGFERIPFYSDGDEIPGKNIIQILSETKEKNKALRIEVEDLRQRLRDAEGDMKVLRMTVNQQKNCGSGADSVEFPLHQREELVQQLETLNLKCIQLEADFQSVLDEKEELVTERDAYKCKVHRLNHELNTCLKTDGTKMIDVDALIMESRYLQERVHQMEEEKKLADQAVLKYKRMLEKKRSKGALKLGSSDCTGAVMSHKQVQELLENGRSSQIPNTPATLSDLKSLCLALLEALNDKTLALSHQRKTNKILANRICDLEHRLQIRTENGNVLTFPSQVLLDGYSSSEVDKDISKLLELDNLQEKAESMVNECCAENAGKSSPEECSKKVLNVSVNQSISQHSVNQVPLCQRSVNSSAANYSYITNHKELNDDCEHDNLPPRLQMLVEKALEEIKHSASHQSSPC